MDRSAVIYLIGQTYAADKYGVLRATDTMRKVFAQVSSVSSAEWFEGGRNGLNPEYRFRIFGPEYHGEKIVLYKGERYSVYRTYEARDDVLELYTERKQGDVQN